ncbi:MULTISPECIES: nucleotide sugar dehydrogenase [Bacillus]|uniref:nucleotide sugar dehydrogenase n=1 Tax=Bacillus TaxID=1386 RepID=UPI00094DBC0D|nr:MULTISPECIES: nucleotide sugar dehydrogenase [Bacillus]MCU5688562.1 nucleotide sugar dehydrogenase [Bacillus cereus]MDA1817457.1 nucleotide sugar dehydrogenase [Bacillus cereus]MEC0899135.1 nucleotide sugar dehydrogenase [Bacillus anthracis]PRP97801.1 UDP-N-acetyl-D-glucosamine 6-dehydrogenase [Bacillus sp. M21]QKE10075.1 nucleotide sugar dehydrogenase [Bacillus cereus]
MKICVVGLGYIGLPTSAMFAKHGVEVVGVDVRTEVIDKVNRGEIHIEEPGLAEVVKEVVNEGLFRASLEPEVADAFIISVPTPNNEDQYKSCDLSHVLEAIEQVLPHVKKGNAIIVESTISPRSMDDFVKPLVESTSFIVGEDVYLVHCPERVLPGSILRELVYNNRIIGGVTPQCAEMGAQIYNTFVQGEIIKTDAKTAEMSKLMENTFRDVNIALSNELTKICNSLEINVLDVIKMANKHPRVNLHQPGPGVGGHCLAVDPYFIVAKQPELSNIIQLSRRTNVSMPSYVVDSIKGILKENKNSKVAVFGVAYKGNVDDIRESPALEVIDLLRKEGFSVAIHDPHIDYKFFQTATAEEAVKDADLLLILTDHNEFKELDYDNLSSIMRNPVLFDTRNCVREGESSNMKIINFGNLYKIVQETVSIL